MNTVRDQEHISPGVEERWWEGGWHWRAWFLPSVAFQPYHWLGQGLISILVDLCNLRVDQLTHICRVETNFRTSLTVQWFNQDNQEKATSVWTVKEFLAKKDWNRTLHVYWTLSLVYKDQINLLQAPICEGIEGQIYPKPFSGHFAVLVLWIHFVEDKWAGCNCWARPLLASPDHCHIIGKREALDLTGLPMVLMRVVSLKFSFKIKVLVGISLWKMFQEQ